MTEYLPGPTEGYWDDPGVTLWTHGHDGMTAVDCVPFMLRAMTWLIRLARINQGLRLLDVADRCGVSISVLSRAERLSRHARLRVDMMLAVCNALGVRFSDIVRMAEDEAFPIGEGPWTEHPHTVISLAGYDWMPQIGGEPDPN